MDNIIKSFQDKLNTLDTYYRRFQLDSLIILRNEKLHPDDIISSLQDLILRFKIEENQKLNREFFFIDDFDSKDVQVVNSKYEKQTALRSTYIVLSKEFAKIIGMAFPADEKVNLNSLTTLCCNFPLNFIW